MTSDDDTVESGDEDEDENDGAPLILGDSEESQLMSVFRAQVDASEARIRDLERDLKDLRSRRDADSVQGSREGEKGRRSRSKMTPTSSLKSLVSDLTVHNAENGVSVNAPVSSDVVEGLNKGDGDSAAVVTEDVTQPEQSTAQHGKITDASDDKWRTTHNPMMEETKEEDMSGAQDGKGSDRLLTLSRISLSAKLGMYIPSFYLVGDGILIKYSSSVTKLLRGLSFCR